MGVRIRCSFKKEIWGLVMRAKVKYKVRAYSLTFHKERSQDLVEQRTAIHLRI